MADTTDRARGDDPADAAWEDHVAYERENFINQLVRRGFNLTRDNSQGAKSDAELTDGRVTVILEDGFPYSAPRVRSDTVTPMSWHRDRGGFLCLYASLDRDGLPWLTVDQFLARIDEWFEKNEAGWPDDPPALDLEAYLDELPIDPRYVLYADLARYTDDYVRLREVGTQIRIVDDGKIAKNSTKGFLSGYVTDIGEVTTPPLGWDDLLSRLDEGEKIQRAVQNHRVDVLLVQYRRRDQRGAIALTFPTGNPPAAPPMKGKAKRNRFGRKPHLALSASMDESAMRLRSGNSASVIKDKKVYVVGAGALGSHICDALVRAGIGELTIRDHQILTPGNMTRHLAANLAYAGHLKARVVEVILSNRPYSRTKVHHNATTLTRPAEAVDLLRTYDLVIDATADGSVTTMLEDAANVTGNHFVTSCLQNEGRSMRIDVVPPLDGADPIPPTTIQPSAARNMFEAGCGEPVSPTPPHAVAEAAAMAARHIIGLLTGAPESAAGEHRDLG
ncbi:ThiF family adenylyltransferase [Nocardioides aromaticivorans]|uniref:ThiF family adenylyltransferase n=1 Tax=Nocardioides aromaticivorans TaxID=200618 RepID=UPI001A8DAC33|nr:ThiF family adenylyltransferase [Nocardioides aromaticivorans]